jgi:hypothetical protein
MERWAGHPSPPSPQKETGMDFTLPLIGAAMSVAAALGYRFARNRAVDHTRELNKIGSLLGARRRRHETNDDYAARLLKHMQMELR